MSRKRETLYLTGKLYWAKVFGAPRTNYNEDGREWTFEFEPDADSVAALTERGLGDRVKLGKKADGTFKRGYEDRLPYMNLKRPELDFEGKPNEHIRVVDAANQEWTGGKIGNETEADVKVNIVDYGAGKKKGIYPQAIRVLELVPFVSEEFAPLDASDPRVQKAKAKADDFRKDFGLDDNVKEVEAKPTMEEPHPFDPELDDDVPL